MSKLTNLIDPFPAESAEAELWGAAKRGQGQAAAVPPGPRPGAGGSLVRGAEQQRRSRPAGVPEGHCVATAQAGPSRPVGRGGRSPGRPRSAATTRALPQRGSASRRDAGHRVQRWGHSPECSTGRRPVRSEPARVVAALCARPPKLGEVGRWSPEGVKARRAGQTRRPAAADMGLRRQPTARRAAHVGGPHAVRRCCPSSTRWPLSWTLP